MGAFLSAAIPLILTYGPTVLSLIQEFGPPIWNALAPLVKQSFAGGTLPADVAKLITVAQTIGPALGDVSSLGDLADALGSLNIQSAAVESPAMEHAAGPVHGGR